MSDGFVLKIDDNVLNKIKKVDDAIENLGNSCEKMANQISEAVKDMDASKIRSFVKELENAKNKISDINIKVGVSNKGQITQDIDTVNKLIDTLVRLQEENKKLQSQQLSARGITIAQEGQLSKKESQNTYMKLANDIKALRNEEQARYRELSIQNKENIAQMKERSANIRIISNEEIAASQIASKKRIAEAKNTANEEIAETKRASKAKIQELNRLAKAYKQLPTTISSKDAGSLISSSLNATSINQRITAIKNLQNATRDLDTTDKRYQSTLKVINKEIQRQQLELKKLGVTYSDVAKRQSNLFDITGQLARRFALLFSVSQLVRFVNKMIEVRKAFELQQKSLQVLLQNKNEANKLWVQTVDLAVQSPFRVKELITYTKQLAAYRIETDKLYDTNKRLADLSAGLGVDMQRLILAFGQVKAASFLRGCLGYNTPVMLFDGTVKNVQDIEVGDILINEKGEAINVLELIRGRETMYLVEQISGDNRISYRVNRNHILTLWNVQEQRLEDVYVYDYLKNTEAYLGLKIIDGEKVYYDIEVTKDKIDDYYGFVLDGNKRFRLGDGTITHNTELRQFTEAGIPMLEELAEYLSEIQGRAISVGEVFNMISKRMVSFTDVENVIKRMTDIGGVFYDMQAEQANTIQGMISNLGDTFDLMFNEMGRKKQDIIKSFINIIKNFAENWETVGVTIKNIIQLFALLVTQIGLARIATGSLTKSMTSFKNSLIGIANSLKMLKANPYIVVITTIIAAIIKLTGRIKALNKEIDGITEEYRKLSDEVSKISLDFNIEYQKENPSIEKLRQQLTQLRNLAKNYDITVMVTAEADEEKIKEVFDEVSNKILELNEFANRFSTVLYKDTGGSLQIFDKNIFDNLTKFEKAQDKLIEADTYRIRNVTELNKHQEELNETQKQGLEMIQSSQKADESRAQYLERIASGYEKLIGQEYINYSTSGEYYRYIEEYGSRGVLNYIKNIDELSKTISRYRKLQQRVNEDFKESAQGIDALFTGYETEEDIIKNLNSALTGLSADVISQTGRDILKELLEGQYQIDLDIQPEIKQADLLQWQENFNALFDTLEIKISGFDKITDPTVQRETKLEEINKLLKTQEDLIQRISQGSKEAYPDYDMEQEKKIMEALKTMQEWLGGGGEKQGKDRWSERVKILQDLHNEYIKLNKTLDETNSKALAFKKYQEALKTAFAGTAINITDIDFTTEEGMLKTLDDILKQIPEDAKDSILNVQKIIADITGEQEITVKIANDEQIVNEIEELFSDYELSLELKDMNIPQDLIKDIFDIESIDLSSLGESIKAKEKDFTGTDMEKKYQGFLDRLNKMEEENNTKNLKKYTEYLVKEQHERVKIRLETLKKLQEVEDIKGYTDEQKKTIKGMIKQKGEEALAKQRWDEFASSPMYVQFFEDVENMGTTALNAMLERMQTLKNELKDAGLPASDLKEIMSQMSKIEDELQRRNPYKGLAKNAKDFFKNLKAIKELEKERITLQQSYDDYEKEYNKLSIEYAEKRAELDKMPADSEDLKKKKQETEDLLKNLNAVKKSLDDVEADISRIDSSTTSLNTKINDTGVRLLEIANYTHEVTNSFMGLARSIGGFSSEMEALWDIAMEMEQNLVNVVGGILRAIYTEDKVGGVVQALTGVVGLIENIATLGDTKREQAVQRQLRILDDIKNKYEDLNDVLDDAWNVDDILEYNKQLEKLNEQAISYQRAAINAQKAKKGATQRGTSEWSELQDMYRELEELENQAIERQNEIFSMMTDGVIDSILSTSRTFVDSWYEAFQETKDGMTGLEESFDDMFLNIAKQQAAMQIVGVFVGKWQEMLKDMALDGLSTSEVAAWAETIKNDFPILNDQLENFFNAIDTGLTGTGNELTGLQKGLQQLTESTGQELASYLNSIRFIVADSNAQLKLLVTANSANSATRIENPMVEQLKIIAKQSSQINTLLNSLTAPHPTQTGRGFKVII